MSEYNFNYKCISMKKDNTNDRALQFMVYQDYFDNGIIKIQVYIPKTKELEEKLVCVKLLYSDHAVDFPNLTGDREKDRKIWQNAETFNARPGGNPSTLKSESSIYIKAKAQNGSLSGTGLIGLIMNDDPEGENGVPSVENVYKFVTNFDKKESINYRVLEHKGFIVFDIVYPKLSKEVKLNILTSENHKPLMNKDNDPKNLLLDEKGEPYVITLKKTSRQHDGLSIRIKTKLALTHDFRLIFNDETNNNFYILSDESDSTIEDAKTIKENKSNSHSHKKEKEKEVLCPVCGRKILPPKDKGTGIYDCQGVHISTKRLNGKKRTIVCNHANEEFNFAENVYLVLPDKITEKPSLNIAFAGAQKSGKTIFISSLINMQLESQEHRIYNASSFILNSILAHFDKKADIKKLPAEEIKTKTIEVIDNKDKKDAKNTAGEEQKETSNTDITKNTVSYTDSYQTFRREGSLDKRYVLTVGQGVEKQTSGTDAEILSYNPVGFEMNDLGYIYLYDIPGECFNPTYKGKIRTFDITNGIIAIIDGSEEKDDDPFKRLDYVLKKILVLANKNEDEIHKIPLAVVFTKLDLKLSSQNDKTIDLNKYKNCFDENCHLVRENILDILPKNRQYHNSELERHIDYSSYEIEHFLRSYNKENAATIAALKNKYKDIKFFAVSALGSDNCLQAADNENIVLFKPKRLRLELPIVWLMYKNGLIRR